MTPLLEASGLDAGYRGVTVVRDLDLAVNPGELVALLGANGSGKTTTLLTLAGELSPSKGVISLKGEAAPSGLHRLSKRGVGLITEERSVFMRLTVAQNLAVGRCDTESALEVFPELRPLLNRRAGLLSGGEQQILTLARALARRPRVLLADELSLGLAPQVVDRLLKTVRRAADDGLGALVVEQHVHKILDLADRVYVLQRGRLVFAASASEARSRIGEIEASYLAAEAG